MSMMMNFLMLLWFSMTTREVMPMDTMKRDMVTEKLKKKNMDTGMVMDTAMVTDTAMIMVKRTRTMKLNIRKPWVN